MTAQRGDRPRRDFLPLLVPVEGHAVVCQPCGALVLDNPNALAVHRAQHGRFRRSRRWLRWWQGRAGVGPYRRDAIVWWLTGGPFRG